MGLQNTKVRLQSRTVYINFIEYLMHIKAYTDYESG